MNRMRRKSLPEVTVTLTDIVGGGQAIGTLESGKKVFVWGGLPDETVKIQLTKQKSHFAEGFVTEVLQPGPERINPRDPDSFLSTSPWQIIDQATEQHFKASLIEEAFELHNIVLPNPIEITTIGSDYHYRNKMEYSFWVDTETNELSLAFHKRGGRGKIAIKSSSLAMPVITEVSQKVIAMLNQLGVEGRALKTLLVRANQADEVRWQLYVKDENFDATTALGLLPSGGEIILSNPQSPASVITKRLTPVQAPLSDEILDTNFRYATEGFFQINLPVYEEALRDIKQWVPENRPLLDLYSGVGSIGLTVGSDAQQTVLVEQNESAVNEMRRNITALNKNAAAVLASSEQALETITTDKTVIVDPPRAGLHKHVIEQLLDQAPERIIYLSCNPTTQARDVALLADKYGVRHHQGYNFFPKTPHTEHLIVLDKK